MRVVELNRRLVRQRVPVVVGPPETAHQVRERAGDEEIFLHKTQALTPACRVIWIQYARERFGVERVRERTDEIADAEPLKVKIVRRRRRPEAQRVDRLPAESDHWPVVSNYDQARV